MKLPSHSLSDLPEDVLAILMQVHIVEEPDKYRARVLQADVGSGGLFSAAASVETVQASTKTVNIIWATETQDHGFGDPIPVSALASIVPRVEKSKEEQKRRVKTKAEVFTPSWVCNLQNNLVDDEVVGPNSFNKTEGPASKTWTPTKKPVAFREDYTWAHYVTENRLEMTCGEGPYLVSRYDTVTGDAIPVRSKRGWERIGLLDRKLRVVTENVRSEEEWIEAALYALKATYGFEWQGDNLLLARLNILNTVEDYYREVWKAPLSHSVMLRAAEIISWNLWQMDGLKMVLPETCSPSCAACGAKARGGHDGLLAAVKFGNSVRAFESLLPSSMIAPARPKKVVSEQAGKPAKAAKNQTSLFDSSQS